MEGSPTHSNTILTEAASLPLFRKQLYFTLVSNHKWTKLSFADLCTLGFFVVEKNSNNMYSANNLHFSLFLCEFSGYINRIHVKVYYEDKYVNMTHLCSSLMVTRFSPKLMLTFLVILRQSTVHYQCNISLNLLRITDSLHNI